MNICTFISYVTLINMIIHMLLIIINIHIKSSIHFIHDDNMTFKINITKQSNI